MDPSFSDRPIIIADFTLTILCPQVQARITTLDSSALAATSGVGLMSGAMIGFSAGYAAGGGSD